MATTIKAPKSAKTTAVATQKAAPRGSVKAKAKTAAIAAKPAKVAVRKASPAKVAAPKVAASKVATPKPIVKAVARPPQQPAKTAPMPAKLQISGEQRRHYVEVAAYFIAERNGFSATSALDHWTQAEAEIDRLLKEGRLNA
ncbi:MAG: DUF2934 domain-containing protein [Sterolibacterium sp.]|nr:DUF2934 domain-containing protein [Sterolibacterium sp.]